MGFGEVVGCSRDRLQVLLGGTAQGYGQDTGWCAEQAELVDGEQCWTGGVGGLDGLQDPACGEDGAA